MSEHYLVAFLILLCAYLIRGITGFGSGLIAIPLLAHFLPLSFVVPMVLVTDVVASVILSGQTRLSVRWDEIGRLIIPSIAGMFIGAFLLVNLPQEPMLIGLGCFVVFFGVRYLLNVHSETQVSRWWSLPAGLLGGSIGAMFGTGGPPYVIYLAHRLHDKTQLRGTLSGLFMIEGGLRLFTFIIIGLFMQPDIIEAIVLALPVMAAGLFIGHRVHLGISHQQQLAVIGLLLIGSGGSLIAKVMV